METIRKAKETNLKMVQLIRELKGYKHFRVKDYSITLLDEVWACSCMGYYYKKKCTHIEQCKEYMKNIN